MGLFGDTDFDDVDDEVFSIPSGWYHMVITDDEVKDQKNQDDVPEEDRIKRWFVKFAIAEGEYEDDSMMINFRLRKPNETDKQAKRDRTQFKNFMTAIGYSVPQMNALEPGELGEAGIHVWAYCEKNGKYTNPTMKEGQFRLWKPEDSAGTGGPTTSSNDALSVFGG